MRIRKSTWFILGSFAVGFAIPAAGALFFPDVFFSSRGQVREYLNRFGGWGPIVFVAISIVPIVVTPLNHSIFGLAGGFVYGPWLGFVLNWAAKVIGTLINFGLGRALGRGMVQRWISEEVLRDYDLLFERGKWALFLLYSVPFLTNDTLSYLAGVSGLKLSVFFIIMSFGHIGTALSLAYLGSGAQLTDPLFIIIVSGTMSAFLAYLFVKPRRPEVSGGSDDPTGATDL